MKHMMSTVLYWKLAIWKAVSGSLLVVAGAIPSAILNWDTMTIQGRIVAVLGIFVALLKFLDAFFDQTAARLASGKPPVAIDGNGYHHHDDTTPSSPASPPSP